LEQRGVGLSIFDLSNAWWPVYGLGFGHLYEVITKLLPISSQDTLFLGTARASLVDSWNTSHVSHIYSGGTHTKQEVEFKKAEGYPLRASFTYFGAHLKNLVEPKAWKQFEHTLLDWTKCLMPLSSEVERVDSHLLKDWRLPDLRSKYILHYYQWRIVPKD
jgi:hypothetical protein